MLTFPFPWRRRLGYDASLLAALTRIFVTEVLAFYTRRMALEGIAGGQSGAVVVVQRTSSDQKRNPHLHVVFLDGVYRAQREHVLFLELPHLRTRVAALAASATSGRTPPAGPEWRRGALPRTGAPLSFDKPLCVALDGFTLHAATRAGALDGHGREALLKYVLRPPIAQEPPFGDHEARRVVRGPGGLVRIALKRAFSDGTTAIDMDPLSLLSRLAASVPAPRAHTVKYAGVLAAASKLRARVVPKCRRRPRSTQVGFLNPG